MGQPQRVVVEPLEVDQELFALGLKRSDCQEVLKAALWGRQSCTDYDPPAFPGWSQYGIGTRAFRQIHMEHYGWSKCNKNQFCRTIRPDGNVAVLVCSGDEGTGNPDKEPRSQNPKGPVSEAAIDSNRLQYELTLNDRRKVQAASDEPTLWFLLVNIRGGQVFGELSLPINLDKDRRAHEWERRIMLTPTDGDGFGKRRNSGESAPELDIDLGRR